MSIDSVIKCEQFDDQVSNEIPGVNLIQYYVEPEFLLNLTEMSTEFASPDILRTLVIFIYLKFAIFKIMMVLSENWS